MAESATAAIAVHPIPGPDGEIGRRSGLKIRIEQSSGGSSPPPGTKSRERYIIERSLVSRRNSPAGQDAPS